jgi:type II secretory pathway pseudopilin PulG
MGGQAIVVRGFDILSGVGVVVVIVVSLVSGVAFLNLKHITNKQRQAEKEKENKARVQEQERIAASFSQHRDEKRSTTLIEDSKLARVGPTPVLPDTGTGDPSGAERGKSFEA